MGWEVKLMVFPSFEIVDVARLGTDVDLEVASVKFHD